MRWPGPALLVAAGLAVAVHLYGLYRVTGPPTPTWFPAADKVEHAVGFAVPVFLILLALSWYDRASRRRTGLVVGLFAAHAVVSELIQHAFYTTRTGDPRDAVADLCGVALGWLAHRLVVDRIARSRR